MKARYGSLDLAAAVAELQKYQGLRVSNIYDVDAKTYLFKMQQSERKGVILVESGVRIHSTDYEWPKSQMPSNFSMKMRKHLRSKRLESIKQLGVDRVIDMEFGYGEACYHLLIEFYAKGNIVLTNAEYEILNILRPRTHKETADGPGTTGTDDTDNGDVRIAVGEVYPFQLTKQNFNAIDEQSLRTRLSEQPTSNLKKALAGFIDFSPPVAEHCLRQADINVMHKVSDFNLDEGSQDIATIFAALEKAKEISTSITDFKGYIIQKAAAGKKGGTAESAEDPKLFYDEFHPILYAQHTNKHFLEFATFNQAVDEFFSKKESQKLDQQAMTQERSVMKKLENLQLHHKQAMEDLQAEQARREVHANLIEMNLTQVDAAIQAVNSLVATGMSWSHVEDMVDEARLMDDPVADTIISLNLKSNRIILALSDIYATNDDGDNDAVSVEIDLAQNAFGNASQYHSKKKQAKEKEKRTADTSQKAIKSVEKATKEKVKDLQLRTEIAKSRKVLWFEKFLWFITSENYLVIAGRDAQQNEILVKKYLRAGDIYVHADMHGAATCIVKNHSPTNPIPPKSLTEAGAMAICSSAAWEAKIVISAYWVHHSQVSKTAPTGEYLPTGSFMVRGKKNFLPPTQLVLGVGVLFRVTDDCVAAHANERRVRDEDDSAASAMDYERRSHQKQDVHRHTSKDDGQAETINQESESDSTPQRLGQAQEPDTTTDAQDTERLTDAGAVQFGTQAQTETQTETETLHTDNRTIGQSDTTPHKQAHTSERTQQLHTAGPQEDAQLKDQESTHEHTLAGDVSDREGSSSAESDLDPDEDYINAMEYPETDVARRAYNTYGQAEATNQAGDASNSDASNSDDGPDDSASTSGTGYITARQRRLMKKKGLDIEDIKQGVAEEMPKDEQKAKEPKINPTLQTVPRGKRTKMKRAKAKYADQDEEDRELYMNLLQSEGAVDPVTKKGKKGKKAKQQAQEKAKQQVNSKTIKGGGGKQQQQKGANKGLKKQHVQPAPSQITDAPTTTDGDSAVLVPENKENKAEHMKPEVVDDEPEMDVHTEVVSVLSTLTGQPNGTDEFLFAMAYCAPYASMHNFKYKVKALPGLTKKGKASKFAREIFIKSADVPIEKDLIRAIGDNELITRLPNKVKISNVGKK